MADVGKKRVLWLHTQPEYYHSLLIDALNERSTNVEYVAGFLYPGQGLYKESMLPKGGATILRGIEGKEGFRFFGKCHRDWRADLYPLKYDAMIVSGYGGRTQREVIADCYRRDIPVAMWSDSNVRDEWKPGGGLRSWVKRLLKRQFLRPIIRQCDWLLTTNSNGIEYWKRYGAPAEKIVRSPYYAGYRQVEEAAKLPREEVLGRFGLKQDARLLYSAARLVVNKGLDLGIRAFLASGLKEKGWHYLIAGVGPKEEELKTLAGEELDKSVRLLGFQQPRDNLAMISHADLFFLPSRIEPHGIVIGEAMCAGTPVLSSDICGAAIDLVVPGVSGDVFKSEDVQDLEKKLKEMSEEGRLAKMRAGTRKQFEKWFAAASPVDVVDRVAKKMLGETA